MMTPIQQFVLELTALSKKHGVVIWGCGCCGSPNVHESKAMEAEAGYAINAFARISGPALLWVSPSDEYDWNEHREKIVKG